MSLDSEWTPSVYPVFAWLEIAGRLADRGDGALAADIQDAMNGRRQCVHSAVLAEVGLDIQDRPGDRMVGEGGRLTQQAHVAMDHPPPVKGGTGPRLD